MLEMILSMHAGAWSAIADWATAGIAGGAAWFAYNQVGEARKTREAVAQPNVVVFADLNPDNWHYLDFVIKNFGETPAYNIKLTLPPLQVVPYDNLLTGGLQTTLDIPDHLVVLAPGQEWRSMWESGYQWTDHENKLKLQESGHYPGPPVKPIQSVYVGRVDFEDRHGKPDHNDIYLDTRAFKNVLRIRSRDEGQA